MDRINRMSSLSRDFSKGRIYKITNDFDYGIYIGSTCDELNKRMNTHKYKSNGKELEHLPLYKLMKEIGFNRFRISLIENYLCEDIYQLRQKGYRN